MNEQEKAVAANTNCIYSNSTALVSAMIALGFALKGSEDPKTGKKRPGQAIIRTFTDKRPPGTLGVFNFMLEPVSDAFPMVDHSKLIPQWRQQTACEELDRLITQIAEACSNGVLAAARDGSNAKGALETVQQLFLRLMEILPLAIFCYQSKAAQNHELIKKKMREICDTNEDRPYRRYDHPNSNSFTMVPADWPEEKVRDLMRKAI